MHAYMEAIAGSHVLERETMQVQKQVLSDEHWLMQGWLKSAGHELVALESCAAHSMSMQSLQVYA